jgi:hypothetical protein
MRRILKRLEALERAADTEAFADAFPYAIAYYLGGARDLSDVVHGYARALGYKDLVEFIRASAYLLLQPSDSVDERAAHEPRIHRARSELLAKFGYDLRRARPAALSDALYRIVSTLPEEWRAAIKSGHRESWEREARVTEFLKVWMQGVEEEECRRGRRTRWRQGDSRQKATQGRTRVGGRRSLQ